MSQQVQGGLLLILAAIGLFVLWTRGYLADWLGKVTAALAGVEEKKTFGAWPTSQPSKNGLIGSLLGVRSGGGSW